MKNILSITIFILLIISTAVFAHQPQIVKGDLIITNPEVSRAFYDELTGQPRNYTIESPIDFVLYVNLLVPSSNPNGRYSALIRKDKQIITKLDADRSKWVKFYEEFAGDYYVKGPEIKMKVPAGRYRITVFGNHNQGKYVLAVGEKEEWPIGETIKALAVLPRLKTDFFKSPALPLLITPMGIFYWIGFILLLVILFIAWKLARVYNNRQPRRK